MPVSATSAIDVNGNLPGNERDHASGTRDGTLAAVAVAARLQNCIDYALANDSKRLSGVYLDILEEKLSKPRPLGPSKKTPLNIHLPGN